MTLWILDLRCLACPWTERCTHPVGDPLRYVCPRCKSPVNSYRLIGVVRGLEDWDPDWRETGPTWEDLLDHLNGLEVAA